MPPQYHTMFQQRRSVPNINFSSSYPSSINLRSSGLSANEIHPVYSPDFMSYTNSKARAIASRDIDDPCDAFGYSKDLGEKLTSGSDDTSSTTAAETELDTRMESLCLSVTDYALGLEK